MSGKLDLRFADEDDSEDLSEFVNEIRMLEGESEWRSPGSTVTADEVAEDCCNMKRRWIVLETPAPEEAIVAAVRLRLSEEDGQRRGVVDVLCAVGGGEQEQQGTVYNQMLARVENISRGLGISTLVIELAQWKEAAYEWLSSCGYVDRAGRACADENLLKPTMILEMHKDLTQERQNLSTANEAVPAPEDSIDDLLGSIDLETSSTALPAAEDDAMEALMGTLFAALHKEYA
jgi:hypothetical protein